MTKTQNLEIELKELRSEMAGLRNSLDYLGELLGSKAAKNATVNESSLQIFITTGASQRKPYEIFIDGAIKSHFSASPVRTAIFLTLILDLKVQSESGKGLGDLEHISETTLHELLTENQSDADSESKIRVAAYRFFDFCESKSFLKSDRYTLHFNHDLYKLEVQSNGQGDSKLSFDITSNVPSLNRIITKYTGNLSLAEIRKKGVMYVPSGEDGTDQLLLQMYQHPHQLHVTSLYIRPPFASYPLELLEKIGVSALIKKRKELAFEGYREKRFLFEETLSISTIRKLITKDTNGNYCHYPQGVTSDDVAQHLQNLINILVEHENYNLYLTEIKLPFVLVNYEIKVGPQAENYLVFFQSNEDASIKDMGCLVMSDPSAWHGIKENVVQWIMHHPSTLSKRSDVIEFLQATLEQLRLES